jgi:hypothetical protein
MFATSTRPAVLTSMLRDWLDGRVSDRNRPRALPWNIATSPRLVAGSSAAARGQDCYARHDE